MVEGGDPASVSFRDVTRPRGGPRQREGRSPAGRGDTSPQTSAVWCTSGRAGGRTGAWGSDPRCGRSRGCGAVRGSALPRGGCGVPVAESVLAPPGPIPNPVVTQRSAGEYCGGDPTGGEAAAGTPHPPPASGVGQTARRPGADRPMARRPRTRRGVEQRQLVGLITQRSGVRIPPPLPHRKSDRAILLGRFLLF
jgi:hypothetical protein